MQLQQIKRLVFFLMVSHITFYLKYYDKLFIPAILHFREQHYSKPNSRNHGYSKTPPDSAIDDGRHLHSPSGPSPQIDEYADTLRQIQRAANHRSGRVFIILLIFCNYNSKFLTY